MSWLEFRVLVAAQTAAPDERHVMKAAAPVGIAPEIAFSQSNQVNHHTPAPPILSKIARFAGGARRAPGEGEGPRFRAKHGSEQFRPAIVMEAGHHDGGDR
jgi:hypothetical protein